MAIVMYYGNGKSEGLIDGNISDYVDNDETLFVGGILESFVKFMVEENLAKPYPEMGEFYLKSLTDDNYVGFFFVYDKDSKRFVEVVVDNNGVQNVTVEPADIDEMTSDTDIIFPLFETLNVS